jgi:predicted AAA+ superfamily ATPase
MRQTIQEYVTLLERAFLIDRRMCVAMSASS